MLWVPTDTLTYWMAHEHGDTKIIEDAGGKINHQTCVAMTGFHQHPKGVTIATSSCKYCKLAGGMGSKWVFANPETLVNAAIPGVATRSTRWNYWTQPRKMRRGGEVHLGFTGSPTA